MVLDNSRPNSFINKTKTLKNKSISDEVSLNKECNKSYCNGHSTAKKKLRLHYSSSDDEVQDTSSNNLTSMNKKRTSNINDLQHTEKNLNVANPQSDFIVEYSHTEKNQITVSQSSNNVENKKKKTN